MPLAQSRARRQRFAESHGCRVELMSSSASELGGFKDLVLAVSGPQAWDLLRHEAGGHRVQRVPETESQGRIHTSAATVAVLPEAEEVEVELRDQDLRIDTYRAGGPGGQAVNKISSAIRITHLPTNTVVRSARTSPASNEQVQGAMRMLRAHARLRASSAPASEAEDSSRRTQIGSGDRSERVRTYNFPQNRDHRRTKASYNLQSVIAGGWTTRSRTCAGPDLEQTLAALAEGAWTAQGPDPIELLLRAPSVASWPAPATRTLRASRPSC
jgi:peptide chain release factor 1